MSESRHPNIERHVHPMRVTHRSALIFAVLTTIVLLLALVGARPAQAASYHCQHRVQDGIWSWTYNRDSYTTGLSPTRHPVKPQTEYITVQVCDNKVAADRFRPTRETQCLTDPNHSPAHTGTTFNGFIHLQEASTRVNPVAHKVEEDGSPEHRCETHGIPRDVQRWMRWVDRPVVSVVTMQNLRFPYPDPVTDWRTSGGSRDRRMYRSAVDLVGVKYWPRY
jgi:hypothetical protein